MFHRLLSILFPSPCILCGYLDEFLCKNCELELKFLPHIRRIDDLIIYSPLLYNKHGPIEQLIESFKYKHQWRLARYLSPKMTAALKLFHLSPNALIVPVPLHPRRERERGYNQSYILGKAVAEELGLKLCPLLKRVKATEQQARIKNKVDRKKNLDGAFEAIGRPPENSQLILIDDIVTSGSTLLECKKSLEAVGARSIIALTLANRDEKTSHFRN